MGCSQSKQSESEDLASLKQLLDDAQTSANEQQNLLRFKIEVLVNMLAMEEKKSESTNKRLETLKWLMHSQGVSEQTLTDIMKNSDDIYNEKMNEGSDGNVLSNKGARLIDLSGAIARMTEDFKEFREEILHSFAEIDGKIVANLTTEEFSKQLYVVTDKVSKTDIHILSMRFSDGLGSVSIPEFLEFFTTPAQMRMAKAATAAVRMSLDLLQLEGDVEDDDEDETKLDEDIEPNIGSNGEEHLVPSTPNRSHRTDKLESGVRKLVDIWHLVHTELAKAFTLFEENGQEQIVTVDIFKKTLLDICGKKSVILRKAALDAKPTESVPSTPHLQRQQSTGDHSGIATPKPDLSKSATFTNPKKPPLATSKSVTSLPPSSGAAKLLRESSTNGPLGRSPVEIVPLDETDVGMLVARFELSGLIHCGHFIQYFTDLSRQQQQSKKKRTNLPADMSGISPFRLSSEWVSLRKSASINNGNLSIAGRDSPKPTPSAAEPSTPSSSIPVTPKDSLSLINPTSLKNGAAAPVAMPKVDDPALSRADAKKDPAAIVEEKASVDDKVVAPVVVPPVATVEVVKSSGCCGRGARKPLSDAPVELPPIVADSKENISPVETEKVEDKLSIDTGDALAGPKDAAFNTPKDIVGKKKPDLALGGNAAPSFRPKVVENVTTGGGALRREGLGLHHSDEETESDENKNRTVKTQGQARLQNARQASSQQQESPPSNSRFHRRAEKSFDQEKKRNPLDDDDEDDVDEISEIDAQHVHTRRK